MSKTEEYRKILLYTDFTPHPFCHYLQKYRIFYMISSMLLILYYNLNDISIFLRKFLHRNHFKYICKSFLYLSENVFVILNSFIEWDGCIKFPSLVDLGRKSNLVHFQYFLRNSNRQEKLSDLIENCHSISNKSVISAINWGGGGGGFLYNL